MMDPMAMQRMALAMLADIGEEQWEEIFRYIRDQDAILLERLGAVFTDAAAIAHRVMNEDA